VNASIVATDTIAKKVESTRSDANGNFRVVLVGGRGVYELFVTSVGFAPVRRTLQFDRSDASRQIDIRMTAAVTKLAAVRSTAPRSRPGRSETQNDGGVGGRVAYQNLSAPQTGELTGDLIATLAQLPGVTITPDASGESTAISVFGISGDQSSTVLNGLGFSGNLPRDGAQLGVVSSSYDPSRGGFAGIQLSLRLVAGTNLTNRSIRATVDEPKLQITTPAASRLGTEYRQSIISGTASGPVLHDRVFYSGSFQAQRRTSDLVSLQNVDRNALAAVGLGADSVLSLLRAMHSLGLSLSDSGVPDRRNNSEARFASRIDWLPHLMTSSSGSSVLTGNTSAQDDYYFQVGGTVRRLDGTMVGITVAPTSGARATHADGWLQFTAASYLPKAILNEVSLGLSASRDRTTPYLEIPAARILLTSSVPSAVSSLSTVQVAGSASSALLTQNRSAEARDEVSWSTWDRKHVLKVSTEINQQQYRSEQGANLGTYSFVSLADFARNLPASFTRTLSPRLSESAIDGIAMSVGDVFTFGKIDPLPGRLTPQIQYGLRYEAAWADRHPIYNAGIDSTFGLRTDRLPRLSSLVPMIGFRFPLTGPATSAGGIEFGPRAVLSGGVRKYRGTLSPRSLDPYMRQTGLSSGTIQLNCIGEATPRPTWSDYERFSPVPSSCVEDPQIPVLSQVAPTVSVFSPTYQLVESWRPTLSLDYRVSGGIMLSLSSAYSLNRHLSSQEDVNFKPIPAFRLANEADRPVYVSASSIVPSTGAQSWTESRRLVKFGHVSETMADLSGHVGTVGSTITFSPTALSANPAALEVLGSVGYAYSDAKEQFRGFTGTTDGDPTSVAWSRGTQAKHTITLSLSVQKRTVGTLGLFARAQSGQPYTPVVGGDINGDGYSNDRAFVFNPSTTSDSALRNGMERLLAAAPRAARDCLTQQFGSVAARSSCIAPWAVTNLTLQLVPESHLVGLGNRGTASIYVNNVLGGIDQLLHGPDRLHGWGEFAIPDPTLLSVRGFDRTSSQFLYVVNPQFGSSAAFRNLFRHPFSISLDVRFDIAPDRQAQYIAAILTSPADGELTEAEIKQRITRGSRPLDQLVFVRDRLSLSDVQVEAIRRISRRTATVRDSVGSAMAKFLFGLHGDYSRNEVPARWHAAALATYTALVDGCRDILSVLSAEQLEMARSSPSLSSLIAQFAMLKDANPAAMARTPLTYLP
jgi:hypothetical protein